MNDKYKFNKKPLTKIKPNKDALFKGKNYELSEILLRIRKQRKYFFKTLFGLCLLVAFIVSIFMFRRYLYYKELKSRTWYEQISYLESSHEYTETQEDSDGNKTTVTRYKRFYTYTGKDGKTYTHQQKDFVSEGTIGEELLIYVAEDNNAKSLEIKDFTSENEILIFFAVIFIVPAIVIFLVIFIILYTKKIKLKIEIRKLEKEIYNN